MPTKTWTIYYSYASVVWSSDLEAGSREKAITKAKKLVTEKDFPFHGWNVFAIEPWNKPQKRSWAKDWS